MSQNKPVFITLPEYFITAIGKETKMHTYKDAGKKTSIYHENESKSWNEIINFHSYGVVNVRTFLEVYNPRFTIKHMRL